jgi:RimJ/RimL family protein N-acetyltransferase
VLLLLDDGHRLEAAAPADVEALAAHWARPDVRRFLWDDREVTVAMAAAVVAESEATFAAEGYGLWLLRPPMAADSAAGLSGVAGLRACALPVAPVELVYSLEPDRWGRGLATRASRAVLGHAFGTLGLTAVAGAVDEGNSRSTRVLERLGMRPAGATRAPLGPLHYRVVTAADYAG